MIKIRKMVYVRYSDKKLGLEEVIGETATQIILTNDRKFNKETGILVGSKKGKWSFPYLMS